MSSKWSLKFLKGWQHLPLETAHIRCGSNCGYYSSGIACSSCGTFITDSFLEFEIPQPHNAMYQGKFILQILVCLFVISFMCLSARVNAERFGELEAGSFIAILVVNVFPIYLAYLALKSINHSWYWKLRTWLTFDECHRIRIKN
jgi:hypothetical protein